METLGVPNVAVVVLGIPGVDDDIVTDTVVKSASVVIWVGMNVFGRDICDDDNVDKAASSDCCTFEELITENGAER
jgi:hypothetical protein